MKKKMKLLTISALTLGTLFACTALATGCGGTPSTPPAPPAEPFFDTEAYNPSGAIINSLKIVSEDDGWDDSNFAYVTSPTSEMSNAVTGNVSATYTYHACGYGPQGWQNGNVKFTLNTDGNVSVAIWGFQSDDVYDKGTYKLWKDTDGVVYAILSNVSGQPRGENDPVTTPNDSARPYNWFDANGNAVIVLLADNACAPLCTSMKTLRETMPVVKSGDPDDGYTYVMTATEEMSGAVTGNLTGTYLYAGSRKAPTGDWQACNVQVVLKNDGKVTVGFQSMQGYDNFEGNYKVYTDADGVQFIIVTDLYGSVTKGQGDTATTTSGTPKELNGPTYYWYNDDSDCIFVLLGDGKCAPYATAAGSSDTETPEEPDIKPDTDVKYVTTPTDAMSGAVTGNLTGTYNYAGVAHNGPNDNWTNVTVAVKPGENGAITVTIAGGGPPSNYTGTYTVYTDGDTTYVIISGLVKGEEKPNDGANTYSFIDEDGNCIFVLGDDDTCAPMVEA